MTGRVMIVTGANVGIGFEVARQLAEGGNDVILACRDNGMGAGAVASIKAEFPNSLVQFMQLDLSSMTSIKDFVKEFMKKKRKLNVIINNAAVQLGNKDLTRRVTSDGHEVTMATNYFGMFLLTNMLLDYLIQTSRIVGDSRIINVTCSAHDPDNSFISKGLKELEVNNLQLEKSGTFSSAQAYKNSKLCGVLFTYYLSEQLRGTEVTINCVDPGFVPKTSLQRHASALKRGLSVCCLHNTLRCAQLTKTAKQAAKEIVDLVINDKYENRTGKYFKDGVEDRSSIESYDVDLQKSLWKESCRILDFRSSLVEEDMDRISLGDRADDPLLHHS